MTVRINGPDGPICEPVAEFKAAYVLQHFDDGLVWNCAGEVVGENIYVENGNDFTQIVEIEGTCGF